MAVAAFEIKNEKSAETICRLCFTERDHYRLIFEDEYSTLAERIENLTTLKIINVPNAPASLCLECENVLQNFESFREMCFTNDRVIRAMFSHDDSRNSHTALSDNMLVINEITIDQSEDLQINKLDSPIDSQVDDNEITIEYPDIKIEDGNTLNSIGIEEDDDDVDEKAKSKSIPNTEELPILEKSESRLKKVSLKKERHICNLCDKGFGNARNFKMHIQSHTNKTAHKCKDCGKSFISPFNLKRHMRSHTGLKPFSCDRCEGKFSHASSLIRHKQLHLKKDLKTKEKNDSLLEPMNGNGKSKKLCTICNKYVLKLTDHQVIHKETRPFQCKYCPKGYNQVYKLTIHTRTHTNEKPYVCSYCDKRFTNAGDMKIHIRIHTQERPFKCKECKKSFITVSHLKQHGKTHSGIKRFSCDMCEAKFSQKARLLQHKQALHNSTPQQVHHKSTSNTSEASESNHDAEED